jgi:hypothetical protein
MNRYALVQIDLMLLQEIVTIGWNSNAECIEGVPVGARLVRTYTDEQRGVAGLVFEHESFAEIRLGAEIPPLEVVHRRVE